MKVCGIIAEYNPLHHGHAYHLARSRAASGADYVVAVMSGSFTQRGEPALVDKFTRTRMALRQGADLVLELPVGYAVQPAPFFALGGVGILQQLGVVTHLAFGAESTDLTTLQQVSAALAGESPALSEGIQQGMAQGLSYPQARAEAAAGLLATPALPRDRLLALLRGSNNILSLEYLAALRHWHSAILPLPIQREGAAYLQEDLTPGFASATAIRRALSSGTLPPDALPQETTALLQGRDLVFPAALGPLAAYRLRTQPGLCDQLPDVSEGLEDRLRAAAAAASDWEGLLAHALTRRYTRARVSRALLHALLGMTHAEVQTLRQSLPLYARVLGVRRAALPLLSALSERSTIPVITRPGQYQPSDAAHALLWQWDVLATDVYALAQPASPSAKQDFTQKLILE